MRIRARLRHSTTANAIQKPKAIAAVTMNRQGETSNDVSETMRAKVSAEKSIASCSSHPGPQSRRRVRSSAISSCPGGSTGGAVAESGAAL